MVLTIGSRGLDRIGPLLGWLEFFTHLMGSFGDRQGGVGENLTTDCSDILYEEAEVCIDEKETSDGAETIVGCILVNASSSDWVQVFPNTSSSIGLGPRIGRPPRNPLRIDGRLGPRQAPKELLQSIIWVLLVQKVNEGLDASTQVANQLAAHGPDIRVSGIEQI